MKRYILMVGLVVLTLSGLFLAYSISRYYGDIARGVLGIVLLFLLFSYGRRLNLEVSFEEIMLDPEKGKYFISAFIIPLLVYIAFAQIHAMILFLLK